ncbi:FMN-binding negative transcriptional regulator [Winogradskyella sp. 3972H.M.0a.05]|uniref:FMN-binding negative transcriptional regulator n=1 Tax=Winogradskyella sp. 3972H.M.0a.05 TaxID=2950277 RepID=UPI0033943B22
MYIPKIYQNHDEADIKAFIQQNSFGILVTNQGGKTIATHIPLELLTNSEGKEVLQGHISKANPQGQHFDEDAEVLCIFNGPHSYVSSSWYDFEEVPTWNYIAIHVYGTIKTIEGDALYQSVKHLVDKYEADSERPLSMETLSDKTMRQLNGITGFEIEIQDILAKKKLSQNRDEKNHKNIISELNKRDDYGSKAIAKEMEKNKLESGG